MQELKSVGESKIKSRPSDTWRHIQKKIEIATELETNRE